MTIEELKDQLKVENGYRKESEATERAFEFADDYDWDNEWEAFDPIEDCQDAYLAGIQYAIEKLTE